MPDDRDRCLKTWTNKTKNINKNINSRPTFRGTSRDKEENIFSIWATEPLNLNCGKSLRKFPHGLKDDRVSEMVQMSANTLQHTPVDSFCHNAAIRVL